LIINSQISKNYFVAVLLFLLVFSYAFLPISYFFNSLYLIIFSVITLVFILFTESRKSLGNMDIFVWYLIFLVWYCVHLFFSGQLQIVQVDFRPIFFLNTATLFFCTYYSYLREYVVKILFLAGIIYMSFSISTFYSLISSNALGGFVNIFILSGLDDSGQDFYQNYGSWLAILLIISAYYMNIFLNQRSKTKFLLFSIPFSLSLIFLLLLGARGAFVGAVVGLIYLLRSIGFKNLFINILLISIFLIPLVLFNQDILLTISRFSGLFYGTDDSARLFMFSQAIDLWSQDIFTILFGGGIKSYPIFIGENNLGWYPHNVFLEILCELGIIGLLIFIRIFYSAFQNKKNDLLMTSLTLCMVFVYSFTGGIHDLYNIFFFLALSIKSNVDY
tara:strand:- start:4410 stop:5576 length:1167 start_codon:yes stop_codon:yes gene_type:complete